MADWSTTQPIRASHPRARRMFLAATASLAAFVMAAGAVGMGTYFWTRSQIRVIPALPPVAATAGGTTPEPDILGRCAEQACNYLLLGSDSREGLTPEEQEAFGTDDDIGGENRADTIILVHTEPDQKEATFLSFPRDLWVDIPDVGFGKINSAFEGGIEGGGAQLVARTVKSITGIPINHVLYVDLAGFKGIVDALGGVEMCVPYPMQDELTGLDIPAGCQRFDGTTALAYVRTRHQPCDAVPDFARIGRQQQFLRAVISKLLQPGELLRLPTLVPEMLGNLVVDEGLRNPAELVYLVGQLDGVNTGAAQFRAVPTLPGWEGSLSVVKLVQPAADELFERVRQGRPLTDVGTELIQTPPSPANITVAVYDRRSGSTAGELFRILTEGGFDVSPGLLGGSLFAGDVTGSAIVFRQGEDAKARVVQTYFPNMKVVSVPASALPNGEDVALVVSATYQLPPPQTEPPVECP